MEMKESNEKWCLFCCCRFQVDGMSNDLAGLVETVKVNRTVTSESWSRSQADTE
jgi:hypothetical protein